MKANLLTYAKAAMFLMFGVAAIVFALGTVFNNPLKADNPTVTNNSGKYMMAVDGFVNKIGNPIYQVLVWDTETGKSKNYWFNYSTNVLEKTNYQLPTSPLY